MVQLFAATNYKLYWRKINKTFVEVYTSGNTNSVCLFAFCVVDGGATKLLFEHSRKVQWFVVSAHLRHLGDVVLLILGTKQFFRRLHAHVCKVAVWSYAHFVFEQLAEIVVVKWQTFQVFVQLVVAIGKVLYNATFDCFHNSAQRLVALECNHVVNNQVAKGGNKQLFFV